MIIYTLFDQYDFGGKTIIPFNTHMGSRDGGTYRTIRELAPKAKVLEGLPVENECGGKRPGSRRGKVAQERRMTGGGEMPLLS